MRANGVLTSLPRVPDATYSSRPGGLHLGLEGSSICRFCKAALDLTLVDLGKSPLCESFLAADMLEAMEPFYPLHVRVCTQCWLAQLPAFVSPAEIFEEYAYFSAYSDSWVVTCAQVHADDGRTDISHGGESRRRTRVQ